jgi:hypothetical protein
MNGVQIASHGILTPVRVPRLSHRGTVARLRASDVDALVTAERQS